VGTAGVEFTAGHVYKLVLVILVCSRHRHLRRSIITIRSWGVLALWLSRRVWRWIIRVCRRRIVCLPVLLGWWRRRIVRGWKPWAATARQH